MIDIVVRNNEVFVDGRLYHSFNERENLTLLLSKVIESCLYSGESIILRIDKSTHIETVQEWVNPHVSSRYKRTKDE
jgi:hypothetical protein